jgi:hypothetical protein
MMQMVMALQAAIAKLFKLRRFMQLYTGITLTWHW